MADDGEPQEPSPGQKRFQRALVGTTLFLSGLGVGDLLGNANFGQMAAVLGIGAAILVVAHIAPLILTHAGAWKIGKSKGENALIARMKTQKGFEAVLEKLKKIPFAEKLQITSDEETRTITIVFPPQEQLDKELENLN